MSEEMTIEVPGRFVLPERVERLDLDALDRLLEGPLRAHHVTVPWEVLRRLVRVSQGVRVMTVEARVAQDHPQAMDHAARRAASEVRSQVEVELWQLRDTHPEINAGTVRATAYVLDPLAARHL